MAKSKIIKELVNEEITLSVALKRLIVLANDLNDLELKSWAEKEYKGYLAEDELPEYRYLTSSNFTYSGINGRVQVNNQPLDTGFITPKYLKDMKINKILEPISTIEQKSTLEDQSMYIDRSYLSGDVFNNSTDGYSGIQCTSIRQNFTSTQFKSIIETVNSKVLDILLKLDKEFGNLDDLDIGSEKNTKEEIDNIKQDIKVIIFGDKANIKNSSLITDSLKVDNTKTKITKSNTGKGNNNLTTQTQINTEVNIEKSQEPKKVCWLKKIFHKRSK